MREYNEDHKFAAANIDSAANDGHDSEEECDENRKSFTV